MSLRLVSVTRRFGDQLALDAVSIHVRRGDCYGFIGHNGAGKTTAMRIALGLQRADSGQVLVDGFDAVRHPREARARMGGLIETPGFHPALDGAANLRLLARVQGLNRADTEREIDRLLELVGLASAGAKPVQAYSQGMRQRLGIAQALLGNPPYVLLDEPTNGLDPQGIAEMRAVLRRLVREQGMSVLISSHQLHELSDLCNRIGVLHRGKLLVEAETKALLAGARGALELETNDDARAIEVLAAIGASATPSAAGGLVVEHGSTTPADVARHVVSNGLQLVRFGAKAPSLEEIYLRFARGETIVAPVQTPASEPAREAPAEQRAPAGPVRRVLRYELVRWLARPGTAALLALPAVVSAAAILLEKRTALENAAKVARGELATTTDVTGFQTAAIGMKAGLPLLAIVLAGLASQMVAGELARGTLRNLLLRPHTRVQTVLGKALAGAVFVAGAYALLAGVTLACSAAAFGFRDLVEILPNGQEFPLIAASELAPELRHALLSPLLPLVAFTALGLLASNVARSSAGALALTIGAVFFLDLARGVARGLGFEGALLSAYSPSPLGDTSFLHYFADRAQGISNSTFEFGRAGLFGLPQEVSVPSLWIVAALALSAILLARRSVP